MKKYKNLHFESIYYNMKGNNRFLSEEDYLTQMKQGALLNPRIPGTRLRLLLKK